MEGTPVPAAGIHSTKENETVDWKACPYSSTDTATTTTSLSVVVLGGGLSGLAATRHLIEQHRQQLASHTLPWNLQVDLLEANPDRLGGRVWTTYMTQQDNAAMGSENPVDLGGMYWHGIEGHVFSKLKAEFPHWKTIPTQGTSINPARGGSRWLYTPASTTTASTEMTELDSDWVDDIMPDLVLRWNATMEHHIRDYFHQLKDTTATMQAVTPSSLWLQWSDAFFQSLPSDTERALLQFQLRMAYPLDLGLPFPKMSMDGFLKNFEWQTLAGDDHIALDGMKTLIDQLEKDILVEGNPLSSGTTNARNQTATTHSNPSPLSTDLSAKIHTGQRAVKIRHLPDSCVVETERGTIFSANACIITIPLGVLKENHHSLFEPQLDSSKQDVLARVELGTLNTVAVQWNRDICGPTTAFNLLHSLPQDNPLSHGFVCPSMLRNGDGSLIQFHLGNTSVPFDDETYWKKMATDVVRAIVPDITTSDILQIAWSKWHLDPDFLGSYSTPSTWTKGNVDRKVLAQQVGSSLFFAGEHTHTMGRFQSLDGAYHSGQLAATALLKSNLQSSASSC